MLSIYKYKCITEVIEKCSELDVKNLQIITPGPKDADSIRALLGSSFDVITMANFSKKHLGTVKICNKSRLMLRLAAIWKLKMGSQNISDSSSFYNAFEILTELRSFSLEKDLVLPLIENVSAETLDTIEIFWNYMDLEKIVDEQKAYRIIQNSFEESEELNRQYIFWGFGHLNGAQIDLLKTIAIRNEVIVPYPEFAFNKRKVTDWISWIDHEEIGSKRDTQSPNDFATDIKGRVFLGSDYELKIFLKNNAAKYKKIVLQNKNSGYSEFGQFEVKQLNHKSKVNIFENDLNATMLQAQQVIESESSILTKELKTHLKELASKEVLKGPLCNFKKIKVLSMFLDQLEQMNELSDAYSEISHFDLEVIRQVLILDLPRLNSVYQSDSDHRILDIRDYYPGDQQGVVVNLFDFNSGEVIKRLDELNYSKLSSVGPILSPLQDKFIEFSKILDGLISGGHDYILDNEVVETDFEVKQLVNLLNKYVENIPIDKTDDTNKQKELIDYLSTKITKGPHILKRISPSRIQSYIDCKRKYYFESISKLNIKDELEDEFLAKELGALEHKVIELFFNENWKLNDLNSLCTKVLNSFIKEHNKEIAPLAFKKALTEIRVYSENGISWLKKLQENDENIKFFFETPFIDNDFDGVSLSGRADLIIEMGDEIALVDFKRSKSGIPSEAKIINYDDVQLPSYLAFSQKVQKTNVLFWGHVCLSDLDETRCYFNEKSPLMYQLQGKLRLAKAKSEQLIDGIVPFINHTINNIRKEESFEVTAKDTSVCTFCICRPVCPKVNLTGVSFGELS